MRKLKSLIATLLFVGALTIPGTNQVQAQADGEWVTFFVITINGEEFYDCNGAAGTCFSIVITPS